jgi:hypothetical protein
MVPPLVGACDGAKVDDGSWLSVDLAQREARPGKGQKLTSAFGPSQHVATSRDLSISGSKRTSTRRLSSMTRSKMTVQRG